jgi:hypothetical protein
MGGINIQSLYPCAESSASNDYDSSTGLGYTLWDVGAEAAFSVQIPEDYIQGSNFSLIIEESSPSIEVTHRWTGKASLLRPGIDSTFSGAPYEAFDEEYDSPSLANRLTQRQIGLCSPSAAGYIDSVPIEPEHILVVNLKRDSAASNEDPESIKVLKLGLSYYSETSSATSNCPGRVGSIIDSVRDLFNEATGGFLSDDFILRSINRCLEDIAQHNYWRRETWTPSQSGAELIDLMEAIPDYQDIHQVKYSGSRGPLSPLAGFLEYGVLSSDMDDPGVPEHYIVQNNNLYVWPKPNASSASGFSIYHSYLPPKVTCSSVNPNPPIPKGHDPLIVYFVLKQAFLRDRHAPGADSKFIEYAQLFEQEKAKLLGEGDPPSMRLRSYR